MFSIRPANFSKSEDCPASEELLDFEFGGLEPLRTSEIGTHLTGCEFCSAEVDLYAHYPQSHAEETGDTCEPDAIPAPLFELAEALLKNHHFGPSSLNLLLEENDEPITGNA
jgi:hypothetical protein